MGSMGPSTIMPGSGFVGGSRMLPLQSSMGIPPPPSGYMSSVSMAMQPNPWGSRAGAVVPTQQTISRQKEAAPQPLPDELPEVKNGELRRQQIAMRVWTQQEEDLTRRVTMLENLIRRTVDMPAYDVVGINRMTQEQRDRYDGERSRAPFTETFDGPITAELDTQVRNLENNTYYVEPAKARLRVQHNQLMAQKQEKWRNEHPITMTMSGNYEAVAKALYIDEKKDDDDLYYPTMGSADYYRWRTMP